MTWLEVRKRLRECVLAKLPDAHITISMDDSSYRWNVEDLMFSIYVSDCAAPQHKRIHVNAGSLDEVFADAAVQIKDTWNIDITGPCFASTLADADAAAKQIGGAA